MANHKRGRSKHQRAGCLLCKPHKDDRGKNSEKNEPMQVRRRPNDETIEAMNDARSGRNMTRYETVDELMMSLEEDEYAPEGYPSKQRELAEQAQKRLDKQEPAARRGEELLRKLEKELRSSTLGLVEKEDEE